MHHSSSATLSLLLVLLLLTVSGCGPHDQRFSTSQSAYSTTEMIAPPNVRLPASDKGAAEPVNGIYTLSGTSDPSSVCCWLAPNATLPVEKTRATRALFLATYLPRREELKHKPKLTIRVQGLRGSWKWTPDLGFDNTRILLPTSFTTVAGIVNVTINCTCEAKIGNGRYAIVLNSISFQ